MMNKGQMIIAAVFVMVLVTLFGLSASLILSSESISITKNYNGIQALNVAEGGVRFTITNSLESDKDWSNQADFGPVALAPGTFNVHYIVKEKRSCSFEVTATVKGISRTVRIELKKGGIPEQMEDYVGYGGIAGSLGPELLFNSNARCYGDLYYYGPIRFAGSSKQLGGTVYSKSITPAAPGGIPTYYASWETITTVEPITCDTTYYDNWLTLANVATAGVINIAAGNFNLAGKTWYANYVLLSGTATLTGPGTICATGNPFGGTDSGAFRVSGNARVNGNVRIVCRGNGGGGANPRIVQFLGNVGNTVFNSSVEIISLTQVNIGQTATISKESLIFSKGSGGTNGIRIYNQAIARGSLIAPNGLVWLLNSASAEGRIYTNSLRMQNTSHYYGTAWSFKVPDGTSITDFATLVQTQEGMPTKLAPGIGTTEITSGVINDEWRETY